MSRFIRLRGLPWSVTHQEILDFLKDVNVVNGTKGIHLVTGRYKNTGEAFVELESEQDENEAFKHNKETLGHRYIEIFKSSGEEAEMTLKKTGASPSNFVKLRGLPYAVTEEMIEEFFNGLEIKPDREGILIVMDRRGRATGEAFVQFVTQEDTEQALKLNREKIGHRYIEIFRSSIAEMKRQSLGGGAGSVSGSGSVTTRPGPYDKKDRGGPQRPGSNNGGRLDFGNRNFRGSSRDIWGGSFGNGGSGGFGSSDSSFNGNSGNFGNGFGDFSNFGNSDSGSGNNYTTARNDLNTAFGPNGGTGNSGNFGGGNSGNFGGGNSGNFGGGNGGNSGNFGSANSGNFGGGNSGNFGGNSGSSGTFGSSFPSNTFNDNVVSNSSSGGFGPIGGGRNDGDQFLVHMRGLPYNSFENEVFKFFEPLRPASVNIIFNNKGLHSGTADALFESYGDAMEAMNRNREQMGNRYIELFLDGKSKGNNNNSFGRRI